MTNYELYVTELCPNLEPIRHIVYIDTAMSNTFTLVAIRLNLSNWLQMEVTGGG